LLRDWTKPVEIDEVDFDLVLGYPLIAVLCAKE
jgi:hypothetical protein